MSVAIDARAETLLRVHDLRVITVGRGPSRTLVSGASLEVAAGETIGIVGESGSGKSLTARAVVGLLPDGVRAHGEIAFEGTNLLGLSERALARRRGRDVCMIFQDPFTMLNPLHRCGAHIGESLSGLSRAERRADVLRRLEEVGIRDPGVADQFPFQLSGGMRQRVAIAAALARDPRLLIADEPSTALDVTTQAEILDLLKRLQEQRQMGLVFITHDLRLAFSICDRVYVLYAGSVLEVAAAEEIQHDPLHPYTQGLLLSEPPVGRRLERLKEIAGAVPRPDDVADRCSFSERCGWTREECLVAKPALHAMPQAGRLSACVRICEIGPELEAERSRVAAAVTDGGARDRADGDERLLDVVAIRKTFASASRRVVALDGVSLHVQRGESVAIVGESGSGKTTLGRCLVGLETPDAGAITIAGVDASSYDALDRRRRRLLRGTVQMIFQDPYATLNPTRSIGSALTEAVVIADGDRRDVDVRVRELLESVGLPAAYAVRRPAGLSGGERQRVAIARALAVRPRLIVCDEPVSALDVSVQAQILNLLGRLRAELDVSYLFITHDLAVVRQVADRVYVMHHGAVVEAGAVDDVLDEPRDAYTQRLMASVPG